LTGGFNTAFTYILYVVLIRFTAYRTAYTITYGVGILLGYLMQVTWVFRSKPSVKTAFIYPLVYVFQYFLGLLLLTFFIERTGINPRLAPLPVLVITLPVMFFITRSVLSKKSKN
jgi:putative flippase GtrA